MKKIILAVALILVVLGGFFGYKYYQNTYQGVIAYAHIPKEIPTKERTKDDSGHIVEKSYSYNYTLTFVKKDGSIQKIPVEVDGENPTPLKPDSFVEAKISKKRVLTPPNQISGEKLPSTVFAKLTK